jgi:hypothetical protein
VEGIKLHRLKTFRSYEVLTTGNLVNDNSIKIKILPIIWHNLESINRLNFKKVEIRSVR